MVRTTRTGQLWAATLSPTATPTRPSGSGGSSTATGSRGTRQQDPAAYAGAFRHAVTAMRTAAGQHFTFDWSVAPSYPDPGQAYPGDAYVDIVSADLYDDTWAVNPKDHAASWNRFLTEPTGLNWLAGFTQQHGKRIAFPEWGLNWRCDGHGGDDDPYFIDQMRSWINNHDVAYETYFNAESGELQPVQAAGRPLPQGLCGVRPRLVADLRRGVQPQPGQQSRTAWRLRLGPRLPEPLLPEPRPGLPVAAAVPGAPVPAVPLTGLLLSYHADRSSPMALDNAKVSRSAYVFYSAPSPVKRVVFSLDGKPYRAETSAAYDLVGTVGSNAKPFLPAKLKAGHAHDHGVGDLPVRSGHDGQRDLPGASAGCPAADHSHAAGQCLAGRPVGSASGQGGAERRQVPDLPQAQGSGACDVHPRWQGRSASASATQGATSR